MYFVGGARCVSKDNTDKHCSDINPHPDGGVNGSYGQAPPVPVGDIKSQPGHGTLEYLSDYLMKYFLLAPGMGGKTDTITKDLLNGGGGGGVLIKAPTKNHISTTNTKPTTVLTTGKTSTTAGTQSSVSTPSPDSFSNNGQGYGGGQGGSQTGNPGSGVVLLEIGT